MVAVRQLEFLNIDIFWPVQSLEPIAYAYQISVNLVKQFLRCHNFLIYKMAAVCHHWILKSLLAVCCRDITIFRVFKIAAVRHLGFDWGRIWTTNEEYLVVSIAVRNLVAISAVVLII